MSQKNYLNSKRARNELSRDKMPHVRYWATHSFSCVLFIFNIRGSWCIYWGPKLLHCSWAIAFLLMWKQKYEACRKNSPDLKVTKMANKAQNHPCASISSWALALACEPCFPFPLYPEPLFHQQTPNGVAVTEEADSYIICCPMGTDPTKVNKR